MFSKLNTILFNNIYTIYLFVFISQKFTLLIKIYSIAITALIYNKIYSKYTISEKIKHFLLLLKYIFIFIPY